MFVSRWITSLKVFRNIARIFLTNIWPVVIYIRGAILLRSSLQTDWSSVEESTNHLQDWVSEDIKVYCREKDRLITSEESDEYLLANAQINTIVKLLCRHCNDSEEAQPKIWYYQDRLQSSLEREVELGMDNNASYNRIYVTLDLSLVIKNIEKSDAGIYRCHGQEGQEKEHKFNYRIEPIFKDQNDTFMETGNVTKWEEYRVINLLSVTTRFAVSKMFDLVNLRQEGIILEVISEWGPWGPCEKCIHKRGIKTRRGYCRVKRQFDKAVTPDDTSLVRKFFNKTPMLPCKSMLLQEEFPSISSAVRFLPEFILEEPCQNCPKIKKKKKGKKFKYRKQYVFSEGSHFAISCPESDIDSRVVWKKDSVILKQGASRSFRKTDAKARMMVDTFSTLYIIDMTKDEQGNYTCYVDNENTMQVKIIVISKAKLLTLALLRHMGYLGFILLLTSFCYITGLILTCKRRDTFKTLSFEKIDKRKKRHDIQREIKKEESAPIISDVDN
ncbi:hypothetical protein KPH14_003175 [Odynerus spinipes]|uniref:Ig-like domain-containing protein n=1 Tax=Odynerus spinipes TaxID=1348599 RepID=A0AAD9RX24_9HYME|nr:hypothetical protein KPH14_003175 [Odynerus spinipes]